MNNKEYGKNIKNNFVPSGKFDEIKRDESLEGLTDLQKNRVSQENVKPLGNMSLQEDSVLQEKGNLQEGDDLQEGRGSKDFDEGKSRKSPLKEFIKNAAIVIVLVLAISFLIKPIIVKQTSMLPNLQENNYLFISKQAYRFGNPKRGDIVVFPVKATEGKMLYIKRVIGLPGDVIDIKDGQVFVNNKKEDQSFTKDGYTPGTVKNFKVPDKELFVMGDNRVVSIDSRKAAVGTIPIKDVSGVAFFRLYPFSKIGGLK